MDKNSSSDLSTQNRFIQFCIKGLQETYISSERIFAASRRLHDGRMLAVRDSNVEYRFTMNALMGLHRAQAQNYEVFLDIKSDYNNLALQIGERADSDLDIAATAWTGRCLGTEMPPTTMSLFRDRLKYAPRNKRLGSKELAWYMAACLTGDKEFYADALSLAKFAAETFVNPRTGLVRQSPSDMLRKNWASFGAHSYVSYVFLLLGRKTGNEWARDIGLQIARTMVKMQGEKGQWGWMFHVPSGKLADFYPIYSVHQYGYAPFFLVEAIDQGYDEFRKPLVDGFRWILGQNELGQSMIEPTYGIIWRRVARNGFNTKLVKLLRSASVAYGKTAASTESADSVQIDKESLSFEMGLPLYIFSGRNDFNEILNDRAFS